MHTPFVLFNTLNSNFMNRKQNTDKHFPKHIVFFERKDRFNRSDGNISNDAILRLFTYKNDVWEIPTMLFLNACFRLDASYLNCLFTKYM